MIRLARDCDELEIEAKTLETRRPLGNFEAEKTCRLRVLVDYLRFPVLLPSVEDARLLLFTEWSEVKLDIAIVMSVNTDFEYEDVDELAQGNSGDGGPFECFSTLWKGKGGTSWIDLCARSGLLPSILSSQTRRQASVELEPQ